MIRWRRTVPVAPYCLGLFCLSVLFTSEAEVIASQALSSEWRRVQGSNYDALENVPVRHWGSDELQEPLRRIDRMLRNGEDAAEADACGQAGAACESILETLRVPSLSRKSTR